MGNGESIEIFQENELENDFHRGGGTGYNNIWLFFKKGYEELLNSILDPPQQQYTMSRLNQADSHKTIRQDYSIPLRSNQTIELSYWHHEMATVCILYLHSNIGSRIDSLALVPIALAQGFSCCSFDFLGCGLSSKDVVTAGYHESRCMGQILEYLQTHVVPKDIQWCFWGHSLGAVSTLMYLSTPCSYSVRALILDSPYTSLEDLLNDMVDTIKKDGVISTPKWILSAGKRMLTSAIETKTGISIDQIRPIDRVDQCRIPALILSGREDQYVPLHRIDALQTAYGGPIERVRFDGMHYTKRPKEVIEFGISFVLATLF